MTDKNVCTVVVTYNRLNTLKKNLECLLKQTKKINKILVINNNSTDGTKEYLENMSQNYNNIIVKNLTQNVGGSGGFGLGVEEASKLNDIDYIWGMDDDAYPLDNALEVLLEYAEDDKCLWSNCNEDNNFNGKLFKEVTQWMFVGFFIPVKIVKEIGIPRTDFFIYFDDVEYSKRIIKNGYKILKIKDSTIIHKDSSNQNIIHKKFLGKDISLFAMPDWKLYYYTRNHILIFSWKELQKYKLILWFLTKFFIKLLILNPKQIKIFFKGFIDGIRGKAGIRVKP